MGIKDEIKSKHKGEELKGTEELVIEQTLNKLFYCKPNWDCELYMLEQQAKQKSKDRYGLHASAIIDSKEQFCYRRQVISLFYECDDVEDSVNIGLKRLFTEGDWIHEKWQRLMLRGGLGDYKAMDRSRFVEEYDLSYTPDVATIRIGKKDYVVEIKSMNTFQFKKTKNHSAGVKQLKFYQYLLDEPNGFVLIEDKNDQSFKIVIPEYHESDLYDYIERLELIQEYKNRFISKGKMPKRRCSSPTDKRALKCNLRGACWNKKRVKLKGV